MEGRLLWQELRTREQVETEKCECLQQLGVGVPKPKFGEELNFTFENL